MTAWGLAVRSVRHQAEMTIILALALCLTELMEEKGLEMLMYLELGGVTLSSVLTDRPHLSMLSTTSRLELRM